MNKKVSNKTKSRGITLIALVVTIIVLLILAGITITVLFGDHGILELAQQAGDNFNKAAQDEAAQMPEINQKIQDIVNGDGSKSGDGEIEKVQPKNIDDWIYFEKDGEITITGYKGKDTEVVVPNYFGDVPVKTLGKVADPSLEITSHVSLWETSICSTQIARYSKNYLQETITKVVISEGIENIQRLSFGNSIALETIELPSTLKRIDDGAFHHCLSLNYLIIPSSVNFIGEITYGTERNFLGPQDTFAIFLSRGVTNVSKNAFFWSNCPVYSNIPESEAIELEADKIQWGISLEEFLQIVGAN